MSIRELRDIARLSRLLLDIAEHTHSTPPPRRKEGENTHSCLRDYGESQSLCRYRGRNRNIYHGGHPSTASRRWARVMSSGTSTTHLRTTEQQRLGQLDLLRKDSWASYPVQLRVWHAQCSMGAARNHPKKRLVRPLPPACRPQLQGGEPN